MEEATQLLTITQVAVAIVGFAGIIATFQFRDGKSIRRSDALGMAMIINSGLVGAFSSVLPLALSNFGMQDSIVWTVCSGFMSVNYMFFIFYIIKHMRKFKINKKSSKFFVALFFSIGFIVIILNLLNVFNIGFHREFGPFFISLIFPLCMVGYFFSRLLLVPIWRTIREQESNSFKNDN
jgi:hypothetical protein